MRCSSWSGRERVRDRMSLDQAKLSSMRRRAPDRRMPAVTAAKVAPVVLAPLTVITAVLWARVEFAALHPGYVAWRPPTISRTLGEPVIGDVFAPTMIVGAVLLAVAVWFILQLYWSTAHLRLADRPADLRRSRRAIYVGAFCQYTALVGMVLLSQFTYPDHVAWHMVGSYMLFFGHTISITLSGIECRILARAAPAGEGRAAGLVPAMSRLRFLLSRGVLVLAVVYLVLFVVKDWPEDPMRYTVWSIFTILEVALIISFLGYLLTFAIDIAAAERWTRGAAKGMRR